MPAHATISALSKPRRTVTNLFDNDYFATCDPFAGCISGDGGQVTARLSRRF